MLAVAGELPRDEERWSFELKWDGVRLIAHAGNGRVRYESRRLRDVTATYPELQGLGAELGDGPVILDGEVVALDDGGRPSFQLLQERMNIGSAGAAAARAAQVPVAYLVFDVLWMDGRSTMDLPYTERRALLEELALSGAHWHTPPAFSGEGTATLDAARERRLEGVIAKRLDSTYRPGTRSGAWVKVKLLLREEFVIGGWMPGEGARAGRLGALLVGRYRDGRLHYTGSVGTGFTERMLEHLGGLLAPLRRETSPFAEGAVRPGAVFVEPELVAEVEYRERTREGILRQPSFKGLRDDKEPHDVTDGD